MCGKSIQTLLLCLGTLSFTTLKLFFALLLASEENKKYSEIQNCRYSSASTRNVEQKKIGLNFHMYFVLVFYIRNVKFLFPLVLGKYLGHLQRQHFFPFICTAVYVIILLSFFSLPTRKFFRKTPESLNSEVGPNLEAYLICAFIASLRSLSTYFL